MARCRTWDPGGDEAQRITLSALESGFRLIDTAAGHGNEIEVGRGIAASGVPRREIFPTT